MSDAEQINNHVRLGQAADVNVMCRDMENKDNKDSVKRQSKKVVEKTISAICCMKHKIMKAAAAASAICYYNEFKARSGSAADF